MSTANSFLFSFLISVTFISFSYLIVLTGLFSTVLKKSGESGECHCFVLDFSRKALSFSPFSVNCRYFVDVLYQVNEVPIYSWFAESFYHELMQDFVKCSFFIY